MIRSITMKGIAVSGIKEHYKYLVYAGTTSQLLSNWFKKISKKSLGLLLKIVIQLSPMGSAKVLTVIWLYLFLFWPEIIHCHWQVNYFWRYVDLLIYPSGHTHLQAERMHDLLVPKECKKEKDFSQEKLAANLMLILRNKSYLLEKNLMARTR